MDLFSGAGGMSYGFHAHPAFLLSAAADGEVGKPSTGFGHLGCNLTYSRNFGVSPVAVDLADIAPSALRETMNFHSDLDVLISCAPCTGFSRARPANRTTDDPRNSLVGKTAQFAQEFEPAIVLMENAREMISGPFSAHYHGLRTALESQGYEVNGSVHMLDRFGLPQRRERALVIAVHKDLELRTLDDLWDEWQVRSDATTVRAAIDYLPTVAAGQSNPDDPMHVATGFGQEQSQQRIAAIPRDGGSWSDLYRDPDLHHLMTDNMWRSVERGRLNSHPDAYGRMAWDRPAPTIKRECSHVGNGRYSHPEQDRLCTVREMANLQGFPRDFVFYSRSRKNCYRQIGDAVPPIISFQLAHLCNWILTGEKPSEEELILPNTHLDLADLEQTEQPRQLIFS